MLSKSLFLQSQTVDKIILDSLQKLEARITPKGLKDQHPFQSFITLRPVSDKDSVALELAEYQYENGARVFLMNTPYEKNVIHLKAISWGGYSLYDEEEDRKLVYSSSQIAKELGVGNLNRKELAYLLNGVKEGNNEINFKINELNEEMNIKFEGEQFELILKVIYNYFTNFTTQNKKFLKEDEAVDDLFSYRNNSETSKADSILMLFENEHLITKNYKFPSLTNPEKFARAHQLFKERFADGGDFTFVFVGDFSKAENMLGIFNKYIGNLPKDDKGEFCKFLPTSLKKFPDPNANDKYNIEGLIHYEDSTKYTAENILNAFYMSELYNFKFKKYIGNGSENPMVSMNFEITHYPLTKLSFDLDYRLHLRLEHYQDTLDKQIKIIQDKKLTSDEITKFNEVFREQFDRDLNFKNYLDYLTQNIMEGLELDKLFKRGEFEAYLKIFTPEKIQQLAKQYWNVERRTKISQN